MIVRDISWRAPYAAFAPLDGVAHAHLLHGGERRVGGWSMIVAGPSSIYRLDEPDRAASWLDDIDALARSRRLDGDTAAPFSSGMVGYVGYEALAGLEPTLNLPQSPYALPLAQFAAYDAAAIYDRQSRRAFISARSKGAADRLEAMLGNDTAPPIALPEFTGLASNFTSAAYETAVHEIIERIGNGDFFQANIAQTLSAQTPSPMSPFAVFRKIASASDAFFAALFQFAEGAIVSNSPERFFRLDCDGAIIAEPVKGTRPRGRDETEDKTFAAELLADPKDRAENIMIADLIRNDLSRICRDHTVKEEAICELMTLSRIHHLVSRISGVVRPGVGVADIFRALFPCGSITGAPKIEAMKTIAEIEGVGRGPYCGAVGYIDDSGRADFAVAIRTMIVDADRQHISIPVGGGVTLRSNPSAEYEETLVKAKAALAVLGLSAEAL